MKNQDPVYLTLFGSTGLFLLLVTLFYQCNAVDSWILENLFIYFVFYLVVMIISVVKIKHNRNLLFVVVFTQIIYSAIPNLKYSMFYGVFDSNIHYGFINDILINGFIPLNTISSSYLSFPDLGILLAIITDILGTSLNFTIKLFTTAIAAIFPLIIYYASSSFKKRLQKGILLSMTLPFFAIFYLCGSLFAVPLLLMILCILLKEIAFYSNKLTPYLLISIIGITLITSHFVTAIIFILTITIFIFYFKFKKLNLRYFKYYYLTTIFIFIIWITMCNTNYASYILFITNQFLYKEQFSSTLPARFFEITLSDQLIFLSIYHVKDFILVIICSFGLFLLFKKRHRINYNLGLFYSSLLLFIMLNATFVGASVILHYNFLEYDRYIVYSSMLTPFFMGLFMHFLDFKYRRIFKQICGVVLFVTIFVSIIQIYPFQPLVPKANVYYADLSRDDYIFDYRMVNSDYQIDMINFAAALTPHSYVVTSDAVTRWQIYGLTSTSFSASHTYYSPFSDPDKIIKWDVFLLHYYGIAGTFTEDVKLRSNYIIAHMKQCTTLVYDNGPSFIIVNANHVNIEEIL